MPPKTRGLKVTKGSKENIGVVEKRKANSNGKVTKPARKALADKTNSASDDNTSLDNLKKNVVGNKKQTQILKENIMNERPRRDRRLPNRFVENDVLNSLSNSKETEGNVSHSNIEKSVHMNPESPFKTPQKDAESSLLVSRPRRVCRLPSRFEDHSASPSKFVPVQPVLASTPIVQNNVNNAQVKTKITPTGRKAVESTKTDSNIGNNSSERNKSTSNKVSPTKVDGKVNYRTVKTSKGASVKSKIDPDTNNNPKPQRQLRVRKRDLKFVESSLNNTNSLGDISAEYSPKKKTVTSKKINVKAPKNFSFRVLEEKTQDKEDVNKDVYEFTFDPNEEPPPQKKKKKQVVRKPPKQRKVVLKQNYDFNISKALNALKTTVTKKTQNVKTDPVLLQQITTKKPEANKKQSQPVNSVRSQELQQNKNNIETVPSTHDQEKNYNSVRIEDIAADFEQSVEPDDINYSPVNSPGAPKTPDKEPSVERPANNDPLNLRDDVSFFDDIPVASSSMNTSVRHPHASPWRVEFQNLPIRWHVNSYVKPNMTPAVESSYVNFDDSRKKHVYTNLVPQSNDNLPEIVENDTPNLKQTSIISFMKEVAERSAKKQRRSATPHASILNDIPVNKTDKAPRQVLTPIKNTDAVNSDVNSSNESNNLNDKQTSRESIKRKNDSHNDDVAAKTPRKDNTFFGFDESEDIDQENVSPKKVDNHKVRALRPRSRAVLKEINEQTGPTRALVALAPKSKALNSEVDKMYEELKSATDAPDKAHVENVEETNVDAPNELIDDDSQSVHLFEDIEVVHHLKPHRKSYGKAKKVAFQQHSSDSDTQASDIPQPDQDDTSEDDLADLTFEIAPEKKTKKKKPKSKTKMSKKEEKEAEAWAAGFNSMCEDIEEFPLVIE